MPIYLPETTYLHHPVADAARNRRRARQVRRRAASGEARRRDRAAQPHAAAQALAGDGRRSGAEEHPDDRADRRGQDGNRAPSGEAGAVAVHQGRGVEVHRGGLRRPRRRVDDPRPHRDRRRTRARGADRGGAREGEAGGRRARARSAAAAAAARRPSTTRGRRNLREQAQRTREKLREQLREGRLDHKQLEIEVREQVVPVVRDHPGRLGRGSGHQRQGHAAGAVPGTHAASAASRCPRRSTRCARKRSRS